MKKVLLCLLVCLFPFFVYSQVKNKVCIVRPSYSESLIEDFMNFAPRLGKLGVENPEEQITRFFEKGSSGTGFVYVAPDGKNYIITNCHVIADANNASVIFQDKDGNDEKVFKNLKILAASTDLDLAILSFPDDEKPFDSGLKFELEELSEGDSVYTAGFPGLLGNPSWQFGSGIITNASAKIPEMIKPEYSTIIQHSAQVDAGNSGGPLLVKNSNNKYVVVGVNTWKITNRQDANFSIPAKTVKEFIDAVLEGKDVCNKTPEEGILERAEELQKVLNKFNVTFEEITGYISIDYIEQEGKAIFDFTYEHCNDDNRKMFKDMLVNYSPIMCMRYAIAWYVFQEFHKAESKKFIDQDRSTKELPEVPVPMKYDDSDVWYTAFHLSSTNSYAKNEWKYTNGGWGLYAFKRVYQKQVDEPVSRMGKKNVKTSNSSGSGLLSQKQKVPERDIPEGKVIYTPNKFSACYGEVLSVGNLTYGSLLADFEINLKDFVAFDFTGIMSSNSDHIFYQGQYYSRIANVDALAGVQFQLPFTKQKLILMPYATVQGGVQFSDWNKLNVVPIMRGEAGGRLNFFMGKSNFTVFLDMNCQILMDFKSFSPKFVPVIGAGFSI